MASGRGSGWLSGSSTGHSTGKRAAYRDLDAPDAVEPDLAVRMESHTGSNPSSGSSGKKTKLSAHDKDPGYPKKEYTDFIRRVTMEWYRIRSLEMLRRTYLNGGHSGVLKLQSELEADFWKKLGESEIFMDFNTYYRCGDWMVQQVTNATTNLLPIFDFVYKVGRGEERSDDQKEFRLKLHEVQKVCGKFSAGKTKCMPWNEQMMKAALEQHIHSGVVWIPDMAVIVPLSGKAGEGGYGVIRKVRIANMDGIPVYIEFAGKESKAATEQKKREERSIEALVCPVQHPGVIKFWAIHSMTMEAYTLWWNGESLRSFLRENCKASEASDYNVVLALRHLDMPLLERIVAYRKNRAMLAWALIYIMHLVHNAKIIHNDLTVSNVLLHFPPDDVHNVYIGVCDWGLASRVVEDKASLFGDKSEALSRSHRLTTPGMAPELFFAYAERGDPERSLQTMKKKHPYTMASDAFAVGYLAKTIWRNEKNDDLFKDELKQVGFALKLDALVDEDPKKRPTLAKVVEILMSPPYNFPVPEKCFRTKL